MGTISLIEATLQDSRYALRQLFRSAGFTCTATLVLGLSLAANVAIFAFVNAALLAPLPYRDQDRLVSVFVVTDTQARGAVSYLNYVEWKRLDKSFSSIAAYGGSGGWGFMLRTSEGTHHVTGLKVSANFFRTLGVSPIRGRDFTLNEDAPGQAATALVSYGAWQQRFAGRENLIGETVILSDEPTTIVGVLPREFHFAPAGSPEFWTLQRGTNPCEQNRACHSVFTVARLADGVSMPTALAAMNGIAGQLRTTYPDTNRDRGVTISTLRSVFVGDVRPLLLLLSSAAGLLLLIALINVSSLLLARADRRQREVAVRTALGASSTRLIRQFATEALLLVAVSSALGFLLARGLMQLLAGLIPPEMMARMPYLRELGFDGRVFAFAFGLAALAVLLFALVPIVRAAMSRMQEGLTEGGRGTAGRFWRNVGAALVTGELAIAVILLVSAGLLSQSLYRLLQVNVGFDVEGVAAVEIEPPSTITRPEQMVPLKRQLIERMRTMPGVQRVAITDQLPLSSWGGTTAAFEVVGRPSDGTVHEASSRRVSAGYFTTLQARFVRGRDFTDADEQSKDPVVIVNETLATRYFPGRNAVDGQIYFTDQPQRPMRIVGVVADVAESALDAPARPSVYIPFEQSPNKPIALVIRTGVDAESLLASLTAAVHRVDAGLAVIGEHTMQQRIDASPSTYLHRSSAWLVGSYATIAFLLSVIGLYGIVSYSVSQRTREVGVRVALGAERASIYRLILTEAAWLAGIGTAIGIVSAIMVATLIRRLPFGVEPWDPLTIAAVSVIVISATLLASYFPAHRAASINPVHALRAE